MSQDDEDGMARRDVDPGVFQWVDEVTGTWRADTPERVRRSWDIHDGARWSRQAARLRAALGWPETEQL